MVNNEIRSYKGKSFESIELLWDTEYFGTTSARAVLKDFVIEDERKILLDCLNEYSFCTIVNSGNDYRNNIWLGHETEAFLVDVNIQFAKQINNKHDHIDNTVHVYHNYPRSEQVLKIAREAFLYSRFFNDPYLSKDKSYNIYVHWTESAFGRPDKYFIITEHKEQIAGFLLFTMDMNNSSATIELIAVDNKHKGKKIGTSLIYTLENYLKEQDVNEIKVGTQVDNVHAVKFYTACGFYFTKCSSVYHYWPGRN